MDKKVFGLRLKELRERAGLTQEELAIKIDTSVRNISRLETGKHEAAWSMVVALTEALGISCEAFQQEPAKRPKPERGRPPKVRQKR